MKNLRINILAALLLTGFVASAEDLVVANNQNVTISENKTYDNVTIESGAGQSSITISSNCTLTIEGDLTINASSANGKNKFINIKDLATLVVNGNVYLKDGGSDSRDSYINLEGASSVATFNGNVTMEGSAKRTYLQFTNNGNVYVNGTITGGGLTKDDNGNVADKGTVNFTSTGTQTIPNYTYNNLNTTGDGTYNLTGDATVKGILGLSAGSTLDCNGHDLTIYSASCGGFINSSDNGTVFYLNNAPAIIIAGNYHNLAIVANGNKEGKFTVCGDVTCDNLTINSAPHYSGIIVKDATLTVNQDLTINTPTVDGKYNYVSVLANSQLIVNGNTLLKDSGFDTRDSHIKLESESAVATFNGDVTMEGPAIRTYIYFSENGTVNFNGTVTGGGLTKNKEGNATEKGTVNFTNSGTQTIPNYTYNNLNTTGDGTYNLSGATTVKRAFSLSAGSTLDCNGHDLTIYKASCGGFINCANNETVTYKNNTTNIITGNYHNLVVDANGTTEGKLTICGDVTCDNLTMNSASNSSGVFVNNATLTVNQDLTINTPTVDGKNNYISVLDNGHLIVNGNTLLKDSGNDNRDSYIKIEKANAVATFNGNVTMEGPANRTYIYFSDNGTVNFNGTITGGGLTKDKEGNATEKGTVNFTGTGTQAIPNYTYNNLNTTGDGTYNLSGATTVKGTFSLSTSSTLDCNGHDLSINKASCGGFINCSHNETVSYQNNNPTNIITGNYHNLSIVANVANVATEGKLTICGDVTCDNLTTNTAGNSSGIYVKYATLTVNQDLTIYAPTADGKSGYIVIKDNGKLVVNGNTLLKDSGNDNRDSFIKIGETTSVATFNGNVTMEGPAIRTHIYFGGSGTVNFNGTVEGGGLTKDPNGNATTLGTVNFTGTGTQAIPNYTYWNLNTTGDGTYNLTGATTVKGVFGLSAGSTLDCNGNNLTLNGAVNCGGSINATNGETVTYTTKATNIISGTYTDLVVPSGANYTLCGNVTCENLTFSEGNTNSCITIGEGSKLTVNQNLTIEKSFTNGQYKGIVINDGGELVVNGNTTLVNSERDDRDSYISLVGENSVATFNGDVTMGNAKRTYILFTNGTLNIKGSLNNGGLTTDDNGTLYAGATGTINYTGTGAQEILNYTHYNLSASGNGTYSLPSAIIVNGELSLSAGSTLDCNGFDLTLNGTTLCGGTITDSGNSATVSYSTTSTNIIAGNYYNIEFPSGVSAGHFTTCGNITCVGSIVSNNRYSTTINTDTDITLQNDATLTQPLSINATARTVYYNNGAQTIIPGTYHDLNLSNEDKTLLGDVNVEGSLTWTDGNIELNGHIFTTTVGNLAGNNDYTESHMFLFGDNDIKSAVTLRGTSFSNYTFPIGATRGGVLSRYPFTVGAANIDGTGSITVTITNNFKPYFYDLKCYWKTITDNVSSMDITCQYPAADAVHNESSLEAYCLEGNTGTVNPANHTIDYPNVTGKIGYWTATLPFITYYSYTIGDWNNPTTWTTDPSGNRQGGNTQVPGIYDHVVILNGRTVSLTSNGTKCSSLQIEQGGTLDTKAYTGNDFGNVSGQGLLRIASTEFPDGDFSAFTATDGGSMEFYGNASFMLNHGEFNNLKINLPSAGNDVVTIAQDVAINGNLEVADGTLKINGDAPGYTQAITITIKGDLTIASGAALRTGTGQVAEDQVLCYVDGAPISWQYIKMKDGKTDVYKDASGNFTQPIPHRIELYGNFTNNGTAYFCNLTEPKYTLWVRDRVDLALVDATKDQTIQLNGETRFYRVEIDKGTTEEKIATINARNSSCFKLFGVNTGLCGVSSEVGVHYNNGINNFYALGLTHGTLQLGENIVVPSLAEECDKENNARKNLDINYYIPVGSCLWVDGANVSLTCYANEGIPNTFCVYGKLKVTNSNSRIDAGIDHGLILFGFGAIELYDGVITTPVVRTADFKGANVGTLSIYGGTLDVTGNDGVNKGGYYTFNLKETTNIFNMTDGNIIVHKGSKSGDHTGGAINIKANPVNCNITGGTVTVLSERWDNKTLCRCDISSTIPFWNLVVDGSNLGDASQATCNLLNTLTVKNNLTISNKGYLDAKDQNMTIGGNIDIKSGTKFAAGNNTLTLNGKQAKGTAKVQLFTNNGTIVNNLNNVTITEGSIVQLETDITLRSANNNTFEMQSGSQLFDNGHVLNLQSANISISGTHNSNGSGCIKLSGTQAQVIAGNGNGTFGNLTIDKTGGSTKLSAAETVNGNLRLIGNGNGSASILQLQSYKLTLGRNAHTYSDAQDGTSFSASRMITTSGNVSDGGLCLTYNSTIARLFPIGTGTNYMPATIRLSRAPATYGSISIAPKTEKHKLHTGKGLKCYWHTTSNGFSGIVAGSIEHTYNYTSGLVEGTAVEQSEYVPARYDNSTMEWISTDDASKVDVANYSFVYCHETSTTIDGDYTCGKDFNNSLMVLYSRQNGDWNDVETWSTTGHDGVAATSVPDNNTIVIIGNNDTVTITTNNIKCAKLHIDDSCALDLGATNGHDFGTSIVTGHGTLVISKSNYFPTGDFGEFMGENGGTIEFYAKSANFILPNKYTFYNLKISADEGFFITLQKNDYTILNNFIVSGGTIDNPHQLPDASKTITIGGDMIIEAGYLKYMANNNNIYTVIVKGDINIRPEGNLVSGGAYKKDVFSTLKIYGNLNVDGSLDLTLGHLVNTYFLGTANSEITGNATTYKLNRLVCDKGIDITPVLSLKRSIYMTELVLENGTFQTDGESVNQTIKGSFTIPSTARVLGKLGTLCLANSNNSTLYLNGTIELCGGTIYVGGANTGNDIEYSTSPNIIVSDGILIVAGQIRRSKTTTVGDLNYTQSGGEVVVCGNNRTGDELKRGLFEVCNNGSFTTSGGQLTIRGGSGVSSDYCDIYLSAATVDVTGGTIAIGDAQSVSGQEFFLHANHNVFNVSVGTDVVSQTLTQANNSMSVLGELRINGNSTFNANGLDINLYGNLCNYNNATEMDINHGGFISGSSSQTTNFCGTSNQQIVGNITNITNFANVTLTNRNTLALSNGDICVNGNLTLSYGTLNDGGNTIHVRGNVANNATLASTATGCLMLDGSTEQVLSSGAGCEGKYGNLCINNPFGVVTLAPITINRNLALNNGCLTMGMNLLTFGANATISTSGEFNSNSMIKTNGYIGDHGVRKQFAANCSTPFTFPIGVDGKYTPATYTFSSNTAGYVNIKPLNMMHPQVNTDFGPDRYLNYYWSVESNIADCSVSQTFQYSASDFTDHTAPVYPQCFIEANNEWLDLSSQSVDLASRTISISANRLNGDFTAGYYDVAGPIIPYKSLPTLYSVADGNWESATTWNTERDGSGSTMVPSGNPIIIQAGTTVTKTANSGFCFRMVIEEGATLALGKTYDNYFGLISGGGTLKLTGTDAGAFIIPAGDFTAFFNSPTSILEFHNETNDCVLPASYGNYNNPFHNVKLSGAGRKKITSQDTRFLGNLTIEGGILDASSNKDIYIEGNWIDNKTDASGFLAGAGKVVFSGSNEQLLVVKNSVTTFNGLQIKNANGVDMTQNNGQSIMVSKILYLTTGNIKTSNDALIKLSSTASISGGGTASFVDGPLSKYMNIASSFKFQVGNDGRYGYATLSNTTGSAGYWTVTYFNNEQPYDSEFKDPIVSLSDNEYWVVGRPSASAKAKVQLRYDSHSTTYSDLTVLKNNMRIVQYTPGEHWNRLESTATGTLTSGTVTTSAVVSNNDYVFTFGTTSAMAMFSNETAQSLCNDASGSITLPVTLYGSAPWTVTYGVKNSSGTIIRTSQAVFQTSPGSITVPYTMFREANATEGVPGDYKVVLTALNNGIVKGNGVDVHLKASYKPVITPESNDATYNETRVYSVTAHAGSSYIWTVDDKSINPPTLTPNNETASLKTPRAGIGSSSIKFHVTETSAEGCTQSSEIKQVNVSTTPQPEFTYADVCVGDEVTYTTVNNDGNTYTWNVPSNATVVSGAGTNSITLRWTSANTTGATLKVTEKRRSFSGDFSATIRVYPVPATPQIEDVSPICGNESATVTLTTTEARNSGVVTYYNIYDNADNNLSAQTLSGDGTQKSFTTDAIKSATQFYVTASNVGCSVKSSLKSITLKETPALTGISIPTLYKGAPTELVYTATGLPTTYSVTYTTGGSNVADQSLGTITLQPSTTATQATGTIRVTNAEGCHADYNFDEPVSPDYVWSGALSSTWETSGNWYTGSVPSNDGNSNVIIRSSANNPTVTSSKDLKNLSVESGTLNIGDAVQVTIKGDLTMSGDGNIEANTSTIKFGNRSNISGNVSLYNVTIDNLSRMLCGTSQIVVKGNLTNHGTLNGENGTIEMKGALGQTIAGSTSDKTRFKNLTINNVSNVSLSSPVTIDGLLKLSNGQLITNSTNIAIISATGSATSDKYTAFVNGPLCKEDVAAGSEFAFPVGNNGRRGIIGITPTSTGTFTAGYTYNDSPDKLEISNKAETIKSVSQIDQWNMVCNTSPVVASHISLYWDDADASEIVDPSAIIVAHYNGTEWENMGGNVGVGKVTSTVLFTSYSPIALASSSAVNPLPITISSFSGKQVGNAVELEWTTLSETNNDHFEIERSSDGVNFTTIGIVAGAGMSNQKISYNFIDRTPEIGTQYYRLLQVDYDGTASYADKTISVAFGFDKRLARLEISPNPSNGIFYLNVNVEMSDGEYQVMSQVGKTVQSGVISGSSATINIMDLPNGVYIFQYSSNGISFTQKIVKN